MADAFHFVSRGEPDRPIIAGAAPNPSADAPEDDGDAYIGETEKNARDGDVVRNAGLRSDGELVQAVSEGGDEPFFDAIL